MKILSNTVSNTMVGFLAFSIILAFSGGGPFGGISFLFASVLCTGGVALLVWLPAFGLIGFIIVSLYNLFAASKEDEKQEKQEVSPLSPLDKKQMVFIQYIQKERAAGVSDQQISLAFENIGWTDKDIQTAFKYADSSK